MSKKPAKHTWEENNILDDVHFNDQDAAAFKSLLQIPHTPASSPEQQWMAPGALLKGRIVEITKDHVVVDVGLKSEGLVPIAEFSDPSSLTLDGETEVLLDQPEDDHGQIVLSREKAERLRQWEYIVEHCEEGSIVKGKVLRKVKGGLVVDIGIEAFLPGSQIDNKKIKTLDEYVNKTFEFKIIKINTDRKNVVVSRRELLEAERISKKVEALEHIQPGEVREGVVKNITDFGVFLDLDGVDGLLHIADMTWKRIKHPSELVEPGQKLEVVVLSVDKDKGRVALGLKQREPSPWEDIEERYPPGTRVKGKIVGLLPYGAFIEIGDGVEGLIHLSEMSWTKNVTDPSEIVKKGDEVEAIVLSVQKEEGKISLSLKQTSPNPWDSVEEEFPAGKQVTAEVKSLTNFGAFLGLKPGVEGLVHVSDISWTERVSHPSELLKKGEMVDAVVLAVDKESHKITLGIKQLQNNPWKSVEKSIVPGSIVVGKVTRVTGFGAFVKLEGGLEGLIHVSELSDQPFERPESVVSVDHEVTAKVLKVDPDNQKIALSIKEYLVDRNQENRDDIVTQPKKKKKS